MSLEESYEAKGLFNTYKQNIHYMKFKLSQATDNLPNSWRTAK